MSDAFRDKVRYITNCYAASGRVKGWFTGDAYQFHPHGFCIDGVLIYDHHNTNDYQTIVICNTPEDTRFYRADSGRSASTSMNSNALPRFVNGETRVWSDGKWLLRGSCESKIKKLVNHLYAECQKAEKTDKEEEDLKRKFIQESKDNARELLNKAWE